MNVTLRMLIATAYNGRVEGRQNYAAFKGGPGWLDTDRFNVEATSDDRAASEVDLRHMLRSLLNERFGLTVREQVERTSVYSLVFAKADARLGPGLTPSQACGGENGGNVSDSSTTAAPTLNACGTKSGAGRLEGDGVPFDMLVGILSSQVGRPVLNKTGLSGKFKVKLVWTPVSSPQGTSSATSIASDDASIFSAVQDQLGLKLQPTVEEQPVLSVDSVERLVAR